MSTAIGTVFYNDDDGLERLLDSCWKYVDLCFMIDGVFKNYDTHSAISPDHSRKIISKYPNAILIDAPYKLEYIKRQIYLDLCKEYGIEYLLVVDSDEYFYDCDWQAFSEERRRICNSKEHLYCVKNYTEIDRLLLPLDQPRLIHYPSQIHYLNGHHYQLAINGTDEAITAKDTLYSVKLCHDPHLRSDERRQKHDEYIKWLKRYEAEKMMDETPREKENRLVSVWSGN